MASGNAYQISNLVQKMTSQDKDFRFMATNDLLSELQKDSIKLDDEAEKKVVRTLLQLLRDSNAEVQNLAVKCLGPLINKIKEALALTVIDTLCDNILSSDEVLKETSSIGLKTVISEISTDTPNLVSTVCKQITARLLSAIDIQSNPSIQMEVLDIFSDLLVRFGQVMATFHNKMLEVFLPHLNNSRHAVSKRAINCLGYMTITCNDEHYEQIVNFLLLEMKKCSPSHAKIFINSFISISKNSGSRIGNKIQTIITFNNNLIDSNDDELKEACLQLFEVFVRRCPQEVAPNIQSIISLCLKYIQYDPNYNYDDENDDEDMEMDNDNEEDNASDDDYSDDDDMSWKVRRAAAKTLESVITTRLDLLDEFYKLVSPVIIAQFKEREENVKVDIFNTYIALLKQTRAIGGNPEKQERFISILREQVPKIIRALERQLKEKSMKTRQSCFALLSELVNILPNALADPTNPSDEKKNFLNNIIPGIFYSLNSNNSSSSMKIEALAFLNVLFTSHDPLVFKNYFNALITEIKKAVTDSFYKISSEALYVLTHLIQVIRPSLDNFIGSETDKQQYVAVIYPMTYDKLNASDIDLEVKERAINCMAQLICTFGDSLSNESLYQTFAVFLERLKNEVTRLTCVKALIKIISATFKKPLNLTPLFPEAFTVLAQYLKLNKRAVKTSTLALLVKMCENYNDYLTPEINEIIVTQMVPLISENDLYISQLALSTLTSMILSHKAFLAIIPQNILPEALVLIRSPLLQGGTQLAMLDFFRAIVQSSFPGLDYNELIARLTQPIFQPNLNPPLHKQAYHSISKCIAAISLLNEKYALSTVSNLIQQILNPATVPNATPESVQLYSLLTIAEIGKMISLDSMQTELKQAITQSFNSNHEDVKSAASVCLGSVSVGNLEIYLPFVLSETSQGQKRQYLLLNALKEIIVYTAGDSSKIQHLESHLPSIWDMLIQHSRCEEEGTRYVVAECLGKMTRLNPTALLPEMFAHITSDNVSVRDTIITAIRFTIVDSSPQSDQLLKELLSKFLLSLQDADINVRRAAFITLNSTAHNKPALLRDYFDIILPMLYTETKVRPEYVREVEMGPFKHTVDDALDLRKSVFECMYTLLDSCLDKIEVFEFLKNVEHGLKDTYDIKMLTYLILIRLADLSPSAILQRLDSIVCVLKETLQARLKANAVKQEYEKQEELKRSAIRAFVAIYHIRDADKNVYAQDLINFIKTAPELKHLYESVLSSNNVKVNEISPMEVEFN